MADAVEKVSESVVRVNGRRRRPASGVVYARNAVLTASHVLEREEDLSVVTADGRRLPAQFVGRDPSSDLAVLSVEGLDVEAAAPAEGEPRIGQLALAVGGPGRGEGSRASWASLAPSAVRCGPGGGRGSSATFRPTRRRIRASRAGRSSTRGEVLGIMTTGLARGAALAIPADLAWRVAKTIEERGSLKRGYLGILSQPVQLPDGQRLGLTQRGGLLVVGVEDGSPADRGGLIIGDILATLDGQPVEDTEDLLVLLTGERVGREVPVKVVRGGEMQELQVTVGERG